MPAAASIDSDSSASDAGPISGRPRPAAEPARAQADSSPATSSETSAWPRRSMACGDLAPRRASPSVLCVPRRGSFAESRASSVRSIHEGERVAWRRAGRRSAGPAATSSSSSPVSPAPAPAGTGNRHQPEAAGAARAASAHRERRGGRSRSPTYRIASPVRAQAGEIGAQPKRPRWRSMRAPWCSGAARRACVRSSGQVRRRRFGVGGSTAAAS